MTVLVLVLCLVGLALLTTAYFFGHETGYITGYNDAIIDVRSPESFEETEEIPEIFDDVPHPV